MASAALEPAVTETSADERKDKSAPPAPRGSSPTPPQRPRFRLSRRWILFALALLVLNVEADDAVPDRDSRVCRQQCPVGAAPAEGRGRERATVGHGSPVVAEPFARVRTYDPPTRTAVLADAACGKRSERSRSVRPLARTQVPAVRRPGHVR